MANEQGGSWISEEKPDLASRMDAPAARILSQVAAESRDRSQHVYTQAEMVRAIQLARGEA